MMPLHEVHDPGEGRDPGRRRNRTLPVGFGMPCLSIENRGADEWIPAFAEITLVGAAR
jgi:hypothetical protein